MSHSRFELGFTRHRKIHPLSDGAFRLWVSAVDYAREQRTDGFIATSDLDALPKCPPGGTKRQNLIDELTSRGLWEVAAIGWQIHGFLDWQDSAEQVDKKRESARARMREVRANGTRTSREVREDGSSQTESEVPDGPSISSLPEDGLFQGQNSDHSDPSLAKDLKASARARAEQELGQIRRVFDAWKQDTGHHRAVLDAKRERRIRSRLRERFDPERLIQAIVNRRNDPFLMGQNDTGRVYDDIETLLRDAPQVERLERLTEPMKPRVGGRGPQPKQPNSGDWKPPVEA